MQILIAGLILFFAIHLIPSAPGLRQGLVTRLGELPYKGLFAVLSLAGFVLVVVGMKNAPFVDIYSPLPWTKHVTATLMLPALFCLLSFKLKSSLRRYTAHPMLWGISLWGTAHLIANGDLAGILLFGSFLAYSFVARASANARVAHPSTETVSWVNNGLVLLLTFVLTAVLIYFHGDFTGRPLIH